ncbi:hypothetical protein, partial [Roseovarius sp.]|uniref:hypothetical protein n=1 Tax=Roseovarius sp. TaxID=1486281 RepID=UPI0035177917
LVLAVPDDIAVRAGRKIRADMAYSLIQSGYFKFPGHEQGAKSRADPPPTPRAVLFDHNLWQSKGNAPSLP